jgi:hypothetical protein
VPKQEQGKTGTNPGIAGPAKAKLWLFRDVDSQAHIIHLVAFDVQCPGVLQCKIEVLAVLHVGEIEFMHRILQVKRMQSVVVFVNDLHDVADFRIDVNRRIRSILESNFMQP